MSLADERDILRRGAARAVPLFLMVCEEMGYYSEKIYFKGVLFCLFGVSFSLHFLSSECARGG